MAEAVGDTDNGVVVDGHVMFGGNIAFTCGVPLAGCIAFHTVRAIQHVRPRRICNTGWHGAAVQRRCASPS